MSGNTLVTLATLQRDEPALQVAGYRALVARGDGCCRYTLMVSPLKPLALQSVGVVGGDMKAHPNHDHAVQSRTAVTASSRLVLSGMWL